MITPNRMTREIILVASDAQLRMALEQAISNQGYRGLLVLDLPDALEHAIGTKPHLCVICLEQGRGDSAMHMARRLRRITSVTNFIFIAETASEETELSKLDCDDLKVLSRPFSMLAFIAAVDRALQTYVPPVSTSCLQFAERRAKPG